MYGGTTVNYLCGPVYPRVYGGTEGVADLDGPIRGNLSILCFSVYPRVYGGTSTEFIRLFAAVSLFSGV